MRIFHSHSGHVLAESSAIGSAFPSSVLRRFALRKAAILPDWPGAFRGVVHNGFTGCLFPFCSPFFYSFQRGNFEVLHSVKSIFPERIAAFSSAVFPQKSCESNRKARSLCVQSRRPFVLAGWESCHASILPEGNPSGLPALGASLLAPKRQNT
jgi:hypothetical protein